MGLVQRERFEHDQRRVLVSVTTQAQALAEELAPRIEATYAELKDLIGADFVKHLYAMLDELQQRLQTVPS